MCGIAGVLYADPHTPVDPAILKAMGDAIAHRGPDAEGFLRDPGLGLVHRRLSIIDLSTGDQPIGNEDGSVQIVFNGEIYNFESIRDWLSSRGHVFRTRSDTEVLVHLYEEEGDRLVERLRGMFAFAIWDRTRRRLLLARDSDRDQAALCLPRHQQAPVRVRTEGDSGPPRRRSSPGPVCAGRLHGVRHGAGTAVHICCREETAACARSFGLP